MASGNKPLRKKGGIAYPTTMRCMCCNEELNNKEFYDSNSELYKHVGKIPCCKECICGLYQNFLAKYKKLNYVDPDRKAIERICMMLDLYYSDKIFDSAYKESQKDKMLSASLVLLYIKHVKMNQYRTKNYDTTIHEKYNASKDKNIESPMSLYTDEDGDRAKNIEASIKMFGSGFDKEDYIYLYDQYNEWTARHECNTKAQEEVFKNICMTQLQLKKATIDKEDTKDLAMQLQKWLDTGKLQPKQNSGDAVSDTQTFGTLIDKWENTRPIPEVDNSLKDVDGMRKYVDVFFKGGLAKSLGLNIEYSDEYDEYMSDYTVGRPEYDEEEKRNSALHEAIFGRDFEDEVGE